MCKSRDLFSIQAFSLSLAGEHRFATLATLALKPRFLKSFQRRATWALEEGTIITYKSCRLI